MSTRNPLSLLLLPFRARCRHAVESAVLEERRRIARNLHDGLAQELAFISLQSQRLAENGERSAADLARAADRALEETRGAIEQLVEKTDVRLHEAVAKTAAELAERSDATLELQLDPAVELAPERREDLLRILREAIWNGVRHGAATKIAVSLSGDAGDSGLRMCIADNGTGFDPSALEQGGFSLGLQSMTERAGALGGDISLRSAPGAGTKVEVSLA
jgi:signal transduction histidine kinase